AESFLYLESRLAFFGHTHIQGGFLWNQSRVETLPATPSDSEDLAVELYDDCIYLVNPGSVGQPRDNDPRAAYLLFDTDERHVHYRRCWYDIERSRERIHRAGLPPILADRLAIGR